jgi:hypothetical protein
MMTNTPKGPGKMTETFEQLTAVYVADELSVRARRMTTDFPFLLDDDDFREAVDAFNLAYKNPPESAEEIRELHENLIKVLERIEGPQLGGDIISLQPNGSKPSITKFQIPDEIRDFDAMVDRVCESTQDGHLEDSIGSAAEKIILGEMSLDNVQLQYQLQVRRRVYEIIHDVVVEYGDDDEDDVVEEPAETTALATNAVEFVNVEDISTEELVARVDKDEFIELLSLNDEELEERIGEYGAQLVDQILGTREEVANFSISGGSENEQGRDDEATRIMYEKVEPAVSNIIPGVKLAVVDELLQGLTAEEERALRMIYGESVDENAPLQLKTNNETPQPTRARIEMTEAKTLQHLGMEPTRPTDPSGKGPEGGPRELPAGVADFSAHRARKDAEKAQAAAQNQRPKKATK